MGKPELQLAIPESARVQAGQVTRLENELRLSGYADIQAGDSSIQADEIVYTLATGEVVATGNVVLTFPGRDPLRHAPGLQHQDPDRPRRRRRRLPRPGQRGRAGGDDRADRAAGPARHRRHLHDLHPADPVLVVPRQPRHADDRPVRPPAQRGVQGRQGPDLLHPVPGLADQDRPRDRPAVPVVQHLDHARADDLAAALLGPRRQRRPDAALRLAQQGRPRAGGGAELAPDLARAGPRDRQLHPRHGARREPLHRGVAPVPAVRRHLEAAPAVRGALGLRLPDRLRRRPRPCLEPAGLVLARPDAAVVLVLARGAGQPAQAVLPDHLHLLPDSRP